MLCATECLKEKRARILRATREWKTSVDQRVTVYKFLTIFSLISHSIKYLNVKKKKKEKTLELYIIFTWNIPGLIVDSQPTFIPIVTIIKLQKIIIKNLLWS